ncbi:cobalamin biosynthesis protein [Elongatibacter sediminis]|uniref:Cobalamin biosynthesis protein n=1 Tax=Elongatibacter sediminis TaxID=3119006 RepID=A0AAW9RDP3_9GAMM
MTIIAILLAFALCHFIRELGQVRNHQWLHKWIGIADNAFSKLPSWQDLTGYLIILFIPVLLLGLLNQLVLTAFGTLGVFLLAIAVLVYTFGPRDLDTQVADLIAAPEGPERERAHAALLRGEVPDDQEASRGATVGAVFSEALHRWFGIIFWFAVLGVVGAFLYRVVDWLACERTHLSDGQKHLFLRTRQILDWPAAQLMTLSLAIATDFDSVFAAWKTYHDEQGHGLFEGDNGFLLASARQIVLTGHAAQDGYADQLDGPLSCLKQSMDLVWRILGVWMTVLALLLLIDVVT